MTKEEYLKRNLGSKWNRELSMIASCIPPSKRTNNTLVDVVNFLPQYMSMVKDRNIKPYSSGDTANEVFDIESVCRDFSFRSNLDKSFKNTLRKFDKEELIKDVEDYRKFLLMQVDSLQATGLSYRIKSLHSIKMKYEKNFPTNSVTNSFNDILGIRIRVNSYSDILSIKSDKLRVVDMSNGKSNDDGYRGVHVYYQESNNHYPIEIQANTSRDYLFNRWLHRYVYKYKNDNIGRGLREVYDKGLIKDLDNFREELDRCVI